MTPRTEVSLRRCLLPILAFAASSLVPLHAQVTPQPDGPSPLELQTTRTIEFSTQEGTWISLDLSPDGKTILFELLGDLYTLSIAGGNATPLMTGFAFDSQPRFSPSGKQIVFISDRDGAENLWIADANSSKAYALTKDRHTDWTSPEWTPDGRFILAEKSSDVFGGRELWLFDINGGSGVQITKASPAPKTPMDRQVNISGAVPSPDGKYIYYSRRAGLFGYDAKFPLWQIVRRDTSTGVEDTITQAQGSAIRPRISPDGKWLVYGTRVDAKSGLRARELATGTEHWLRYPIDRDEQEGLGTRDMLPGYAFTPDSAAVVLSYGGKIHRVDIVSCKDAEIPFTAQVKQALGPFVHSDHRVEEGPVVARIASEVSLSPAGDNAIFSALAHLYTVSLPGGAPKRLDNSPLAEFQPAWSPDGKSIAFVTWDAVTGGAVWTSSASEPDKPVRITSVAGYYRDLAWSPDATHIIAIRSSIEDRRARRTELEFDSDAMPIGDDIISIPATGGAFKTIVPARGMSRPQFVRNSDRLYLESGKGLLSMRLDGSEVQELLVFKGKETQGRHEPMVARDAAISPDGMFALASINHQAWFFPVPRVGGAAVEVDLDKPSIAGKRLTVDGADAMAWSPKGDEILWTIGATLFRLPLATVEKAMAADLVHPAPTTPPTPPLDAAKAAASLHPIEMALHVEEPRLVPEGSVVLRGANVITMKGDQVVTNADVLITGDRVVSISSKGEATLPKGTRVLDVSGKTIIPGIIDAHAHFTQIRRGVLELENWPFEANLAYGVTAGRDPQTFSTDVFAYQDLADTGRVLGPRAFSTGPGIFAENDFHSLDDARHTVERYTKYYRTHLLKSYEVGNRQQREWMVQAAAELKAMPTTEGGIDLKLDLTHILDGFTGNEHNIPQTPIYKDVIQLLAQSGTSYTPTMVVAYGGPPADQYFIEHTEVHDAPKIRHYFPPLILAQDTERGEWVRDKEYIFPQQAADAAKVLRAGGIVGLGGHGQMQGLQCHWEMWALAMGGMTPMEVLKVATLDSAKAIGLEQDLGSLEPGKLADLVVLDRDPLTDIHNTNSVHWVMRGGVIYEGSTLNEVWPKQMTHAESWWQKDSLPN